MLYAMPLTGTSVVWGLYIKIYIDCFILVVLSIINMYHAIILLS